MGPHGHELQDLCIGPMIIAIYSRLLLTQLCITQYYHLSRPDSLVPIFSPIYYCNSTMFISTTAKSIKLITCYENLVPLINFSVFYNAPLIPFHKKTTVVVVFFNLPFYLNVPPFNPPFSMLIIPIKTINCLINKQGDLIHVCDTCSCQ